MIYYLSLIITIIYGLLKNQMIQATWGSLFRRSNHLDGKEMNIIDGNVKMPNGPTAIIVSDTLLPLTYHDNYLVANNSFQSKDINSYNIHTSPGLWFIKNSEEDRFNHSFFLSFTYMSNGRPKIYYICQEIRGDRVIMKKICTHQAFTLNKTIKKNIFLLKFYGNNQGSYLAIRDTTKLAKKSRTGTEFYMDWVQYEPSTESYDPMKKIEVHKCESVNKSLKYLGDSNVETIIEIISEMENCHGSFKYKRMTNFCTFIKSITNENNQAYNSEKLTEYKWKDRMCDLPNVLERARNEINQPLSPIKHIIDVFEIYIRTQNIVDRLILLEFVRRTQLNISKN